MRCGRHNSQLPLSPFSIINSVGHRAIVSVRYSHSSSPLRLSLSLSLFHFLCASFFLPLMFSLFVFVFHSSLICCVPFSLAAPRRFVPTHFAARRRPRKTFSDVVVVVGVGRPLLTGFYWVLLGFTGFYWVLLGITSFYWVLLGSTGF